MNSTDWETADHTAGDLDLHLLCTDSRRLVQTFLCEDCRYSSVIRHHEPCMLLG